MSLHINRRQWLKTSALAAAGLTASRSAHALNLINTTERFSPENDELILLDQNENPYGISKRTKQAIIDSVNLSNRYAHEELRELRDLIADHENVPSDHVILGAGSTEIFSLAGLIYGLNGGEILVADPSYFGFINYIKKIDGTLRLVPLDEELVHDLDEMERRYTQDMNLVYLCNPNNPTGTIVNGFRMRSFCEEVSRHTVVFVDEAYHELVDDEMYSSMIDLVRKEYNIIISRTFSKIHGLAGLRVGYGIAKADIIKKFRRIQTNFAPIGILSMSAAIASYRDTEFIRLCKRKNRESKEYFYKVLDRLGYEYIPSHTNFVLFKINRDADEFVKEILKHRIKVRPFKFNGINWCRVSMGTKEEMFQLASVMEKIT